MRNLKKHLSYLLILLLSFPAVMLGQQSDLGIIPAKRYLWFNNTDRTLFETENPVVLVPPFCGKKRRDAGNDLAMPFGAMAEISYTKQFYYADDLMLSNDSNDIVVTGKASAQNSTSGDMRFVIRPDVWVLPILNVYGLFGYSQSKTNPDFSVPQVTISNLPLIGEITLDTTIRIKEELVLYGPTYGGGATISAGFQFFFFILDYNYVMTKPMDLDDKLESHTFSGKIGILLGNNKKKAKGALWVGVRYINDNHRFTGEVDVKDILPEFELLFGEKATYSGIVQAKQYWNFVIGGSSIINKHHLISIEFGFYKREQFSASYGFRF